MHYVGMSGFAVACVAEVRLPEIILSVVLSCLGGAIAFDRAIRRTRFVTLQATSALVAAVVLLHFTGMSAISIDPMRAVPLPDGYFSGTGMTLPVILVVAMVLLVGLTALQIDRIADAESVVRLRRAARRDPMTGLPNRTGFREMLEELRGNDGELAPHLFIALDLDGFKFVNDTHGHEAGDTILGITARRIERWLPAGAFAARIAGDEFHLVVPGAAGPTRAREIGSALLFAVGRPVQWNGKAIPIRASAGMILCPAQGRTEDEILPGADLALYESKLAGRNRASLFDPDMARRHRDRRELGDALIAAILGDTLEVQYQAQRNVRTGRIVGFEALLRWTHPRFGSISPEEFVAIAEERGVINDLGTWVLRKAAAEAASWTLPCRIAVNVTAAQFESGTLPGTVRDALAESGLPPERLELEVTESTVIKDLVEVRRQVVELRKMGVNFAMDDFGTGYSAMSTLLALPFDKIKFDKSFVVQLETDERMIGVLRSVVELGRQLRISVLAEGVETDAQAAILAELGCYDLQGFLVSAPLPAGQARERFGLTASDAERWDRDRAADVATIVPGPRRLAANGGSC